MTGINRGLWLSAAAMLAFAAGCGSPTESDAGVSCTTDSNCATGKGCHPVLKTCVTTCMGNTDCGASEKTCGAIAGSTSKFCQCSTNEICNGAVAGNVCSEATKQCTAKCTSNTACPMNYTCETSSGQCKGGAVVDSGVPDAGSGMACTGLSECSYPEICDFAAGKCKGGGSCTGNNPQPDVCGYAGYCTIDSTCAQVAKPDAMTCTNFGSGGLALAFNPKTSTGPIIYNVENDMAPPTAACFKGFYVHSFFISAYQSTDWPTALAGIPGAWYVTTSGAKADITAGLGPSYYVPNGKTMRLRKYLCAKTATPFSAGFFFTGGNEACKMSSGAAAGTAACAMDAQCGSGSTCNTATGTCG